jgi:hypothetical protein
MSWNTGIPTVRLKNTIQELMINSNMQTGKKFDDEFDEWFKKLGTGLQPISWVYPSYRYHADIMENLQQIWEVIILLKKYYIIIKNSEFLKDNINAKIKKLEEKYEEFRDLNNNNTSLDEEWIVVRQLPQIYPLYRGGKRKSKRKPKSSRRRRRRHTKRR